MYLYITQRTRCTCQVCFLMPSLGKLILSVDKDTYEQLGLVGKPSQFQKQHRFCKSPKANKATSSFYFKCHIHIALGAKLG